YMLEVIDSFGCFDALQIDIVVHQNTIQAEITGVDNFYCLSVGTVVLDAVPAGGIFSGAGVTGNVFSSSLAGIGNHQIVYVYSDANGCISTDSIWVEVSNCVGIDVATLDKISVYPNPFHQLLFIANNDLKTVRVNIINVLGQSVSDFMVEEKAHIILTHEWASGIYFIRLYENERSKTIKVVKQAE